MDPSWVSNRIRSQELSMVPEFGTYLAKHQPELFYPSISNKSPRLQTNMRFKGKSQTFQDFNCFVVGIPLSPFIKKTICL